MTSSVYLIQGESYLVDEALQRVRAESGVDPLSEIVVAGEDATQLVEALQTASLFGDRRLVVVHDAQDLPKDVIAALESYIESPAPWSVLVLVSTGRTKLDPAVKKHGTVVALEAPRGRRLIGWIRQRGRERSVKVDERAAWALLETVGPELRDLDAALEQLSAGGTKGAITEADVRRAFNRMADERIYALTDAVGERRLRDAMVALRRLLDQGEEPLVVFGALVAHLRRLLRVRRHVDGGSKIVADVLGMPAWRAEKMARQAASYREEELVGALDALARADVEMKGDFPSPKAALERAVVTIVSG